MLISIVGDVGSGKTLLSTYFAIKDVRPVYANYTIKIDNFNKLTPELLVGIKDASLIIIDEAYTWLESRLSSRNINLYLSYILFQSRKRGMDIVMTDQLIGSIDLRFRQMTNYEIHCSLDNNGFRYQMIKLDRYRGNSSSTYILPYSVAEKVFHYYDTLELISPIDDELLINVSTDKSEILKSVDNCVKELLKKSSAESYTKGIIEDYVFRRNLPKSYVKMIYNAIKATTIGE